MDCCCPYPTTPWYVLLVPLAMLVLWHVDGYCWRHTGLFLHEYLWRQWRSRWRQ
jgi:hypothetical protein